MNRYPETSYCISDRKPFVTHFYDPDELTYRATRHGEMTVTGICSRCRKLIESVYDESERMWLPWYEIYVIVEGFEPS